MSDRSRVLSLRPRRRVPHRTVEIFVVLLLLSSLPGITSEASSTVQSAHQDSLKASQGARSEGRFEEALELSEKALELAVSNDDTAAQLAALIQNGILQWNLGKIKESADSFTRALTVAKVAAKSYELAILSAYLGIYDHYNNAKEFRETGDYDKSAGQFESAIALSRKIGSREHELKCLRQMSINYWEQNNLQKFYALNLKAQELARAIKHRLEEGRCLNNIGLFFWETADYSEALKNYEKSLAIARATENLKEENNCLTNISAVYMELGNYDRALEYATQALDLDRALQDPQKISKDLNNIGVILRRKGVISENKEDFYAALKYYFESLGIARKIGDTSTEILALLNIGTVYSHLSQNLNSLDYLRQAQHKAEETKDAGTMSIIFTNIGIVYSQLGNYEESTKFYQKAINFAPDTQEGKFLWEAYLEIGNSYRSQNKLSAALDNYKKSISIIENIRSSISLEELKASYLGTDKRIDAYHNVVDLYIKLYQDQNRRDLAAEAFSFYERGKARAFLDSIEVSKLDQSIGIGQRLSNREAALMNEISRLHTKLLVPQISLDQKNTINQELATYEERLESLKREIREASPAYAGLRYPESLSLKEAQRELVDEETAFFAYLLAKENSYGFVITKSELKIFPLPKKEEIQRLVQKHLKAVTDISNQDFRSGHALYQLLVQPGLKGDIKRIVFVPDDILYFLPFETLSSSARGREWLIKDYAISYVPSLSSLRELIERKKTSSRSSRRDILALGDPAFGANEIPAEAGRVEMASVDPTSETKFTRLKYSGQEVEKIASLFKAGRKDVLLRNLASEENLKKRSLDRYKIIHFATHALIDDKNPARSAIVLSLDQDPREDGFLWTREIFNLKLQADLVTLSACETGLGQLIRGEGIEGLNRAFFFAGASSVLLSLWAINDQASYQLLERLYFHLRSAESISESVRRAKLELIDSGVLSHPYYWAGFVVAGDADIVIFPRRMNRWIVVTLSLCAGLAIFILVISRERPSAWSSRKSTRPATTASTTTGS